MILGHMSSKNEAHHHNEMPANGEFRLENSLAPICLPLFTVALVRRFENAARTQRARLPGGRDWRTAVWDLVA